jgi:RNA polymerase sigma-70 factor (ECF subfamily)
VLIDTRLADRLYARANAQRWRVSKDRFVQALETSAQRAFASRERSPRQLEQYLTALNLEDLALACACADGDEHAWEHFMMEQRPRLYRAADALDPGGGARDLADSLYAELYGLRERAGERQSLFHYFHGRSSLTTWLRAVLAQRHVDRLRTNRRIEALPDEESPKAVATSPQTIDPDRERYLRLIHQALKRAIANLVARDRLRLACYYAQQLTLAETARVLGEHEATSSRQLGRTRRAIREDVERQLKEEPRLTEAEIAQCFASVAEDPGPLNLGGLLTPEAGRKDSPVDRSR